MYKKYFCDFFFFCYIVKCDRKLKAYAFFKVFLSWKDSTPIHRSNNEQIPPSNVSSPRKNPSLPDVFFLPTKVLDPPVSPYFYLKWNIKS